jgi:hypothetical protein
MFLSQSRKGFQRIFLSRKHLIFCNDVCSVMQAFEHQHRPTEWPLFIDSSKVSLKVVLLHNGNNKFPPAPPHHATNMKASYENMKLLFERIPYEKHNWNIYEDVSSLLSCLVCSLVKQSFVAMCASRTVGTENIITLKNGLSENRLFQDRKV